MSCSVVLLMMNQHVLHNGCVFYSKKLEQLERLRSEDTPRRLMITHTIDQFILLTSSYRHTL